MESNRCKRKEDKNRGPSDCDRGPGGRKSGMGHKWSHPVQLLHVRAERQHNKMGSLLGDAGSRRLPGVVVIFMFITHSSYLFICISLTKHALLPVWHWRQNWTHLVKFTKLKEGYFTIYANKWENIWMGILFIILKLTSLFIHHYKNSTSSPQITIWIKGSHSISLFCSPSILYSYEKLPSTLHSIFPSSNFTTTWTKSFSW